MGIDLIGGSDQSIGGLRIVTTVQGPRGPVWGTSWVE